MPYSKQLKTVDGWETRVYGVLCPNQNSSIKDLEKCLDTISEVTEVMGQIRDYDGGIVRNSQCITENRLKMRIRLRKKLEKKKSKSNVVRKC